VVYIFSAEVVKIYKLFKQDQLTISLFGLKTLELFYESFIRHGKYLNYLYTNHLLIDFLLDPICHFVFVMFTNPQGQR